jgi:hypothetical protein
MKSCSQSSFGYVQFGGGGGESGFRFRLMGLIGKPANRTRNFLSSPEGKKIQIITLRTIDPQKGLANTIYYVDEAVAGGFNDRIRDDVKVNYAVNSLELSDQNESRQLEGLKLNRTFLDKALQEGTYTEPSSPHSSPP